MNGIDLSNNNATFNAWAGVDFSFEKASEGSTFRDSTQSLFARKVPIFGPYHFCHPDVNTPEAEAGHFVNVAIAGTMWALDCETRPGIDPLAILGADRLAAWVDQFYDLVVPHLGVNAYFYTFRSYADALYPRLQRPWKFWLATAVGHPSTTSYAGKTVDVEQWGIRGVDQDVSYTPFTATPVAPPAPPEEVVKATYARRTNSPQVFIVFDNGAAHPVTSFADTENIYANKLGVQIVPAAEAADLTDGFQTTRKVWELSDTAADTAGIPR